jgi:peptidoglycan/xylan/chitin deacetylase (PgdA/CDA1 family)
MVQVNHRPLLSILMYHQVGRFQAMRRHRANYCHHRRFARQMAFLRLVGCTVLTLEQAVAVLIGTKPPPPRAVVLTFDDGYAEFIDYVLPLLSYYQFPAVVYAISDWLGRRMTWRMAEPLRSRPWLLTGAQLRCLHEQGITIGAHGQTHRPLAALSVTEQYHELANARHALEDQLGVTVTHLCYPFGRFNGDTVRIAHQLGYRSAVTCLRGAVSGADRPLILPRKAISFGDTIPGYAWKLLVKQAPTPALRAWRNTVL